MRFIAAIGLLLAIGQAQAATYDVCMRSAAIQKVVEMSIQKPCADVTDDDLATITGDVFFEHGDNTYLARDFEGMTGLTSVYVWPEGSTAIAFEADVFKGLTLNYLDLDFSFGGGTLGANALNGLTTASLVLYANVDRAFSIQPQALAGLTADTVFVHFDGDESIGNQMFDSLVQEYPALHFERE